MRAFPRPRARIVGYPFEGGFAYLIFPDDALHLLAHSLVDARGMASLFSDIVIEEGPAAAFGRAQV